MIMGDPENVDTQHRTRFSIKILTDAGMKVDINDPLQALDILMVVLMAALILIMIFGRC